MLAYYVKKSSYKFTALQVPPGKTKPTLPCLNTSLNESSAHCLQLHTS